MARSRYGYVVTQTGASVPVGFFTVKNELAWWLDRQSDIRRPSLVVWRMSDTRMYPDVPPVRLDPMTLEPVT